METVVKSLSNLISKEWESTISNVTYLQTKRAYSGGYSFTFPFALSGFHDYKSKEYSNFYLTRSAPADKFIKVDSNTLACSAFLTYLKFGDMYLATNDSFIPNNTSLNVSFTKSLCANCYFTLNLYPNNICTVSYDTAFGKTYYLGTVDDNRVTYIWEDVITQDLSSNPPQRFSYIYDSNDGEFYLVRQLSGTSAGIVCKNNNSLTITQIQQRNKFKLFQSVIELSRPTKYKLDADLNMSYIRYDGTTSNVDMIKSEFDLSNNFLIHSPITSPKKNMIALKNQLVLGDIFTNGQNLISGSPVQAIEGLRNYVSILNPINSENSTELSLNYVFYNQPYKITKGITQFQAPSSLYPFTKLNINDTKFVMAGSYAYKIPEYADKVYRLDGIPSYSDGRIYLCTWLSGSSDNQKWVDRYYYPDLITKKDALFEKGVFDATYTSGVEALIAANLNLQDSIKKYKIFDKVSDLTFEPNINYEYHRFTSQIPITNLANCTNLAYNYQNDINEAHKMTFAFYFTDDGVDWLVQSIRNLVNGGIKILKFQDSLYFEFNLFSGVRKNIKSFRVITKYKQNDLNFVCFTFDSLNGRGGFYLNGTKVLSINTVLGEFQYDPILYGKLYFNDVEIFENGSKLENILLNSDYIDDDMAKSLQILQGFLPVDDIYITLPCGMRNSIDDVAYINTVCKTNTNKSNFINVSIDNLGIDNQQILNELTDAIKTTITRHVPASTTINKINFANYL